jgi:hypothetical protein
MMAIYLEYMDEEDEQKQQLELDGGAVDFSSKKINLGYVEGFDEKPGAKFDLAKKKYDYSLEALLPQDTLDVLHKHPNLYGTIGAAYETGMSIGNFALDVIPFAKYLRPEDQERYKALYDPSLDVSAPGEWSPHDMGGQYQVRALLWEALGLSFFTKGGQIAGTLAVKGLWKGAKFPFQAAKKGYSIIKPRPKVKPIEDIVSWTVKSYEETAGKFLGRRGFSKKESTAIYEHIHGDIEAIKRSMQESYLGGGKPSSAFEKAVTRDVEGKGLKYLSERKGAEFGLTDELLAKINPEKVRLDQLRKDFARTVTSPEALGRTIEGSKYHVKLNTAYKAEAERYFGKDVAADMSLANANEEMFVNFIEDIIQSPKAVRRSLDTPLMTALSPIRNVFGMGEAMGLGTKKGIYIPLSEANRRSREFVTGMVNTFQSMMEQRGFGKTVLKKGKISFKDTTGITDTVRKKAGVVLHETNKIMGEAGKINTPEAYAAAKQKISSLANPKDPDHKMVGAMVDTCYDMFDTLYAIDAHDVIAKAFTKAGLSPGGRASFEKILSSEAPKIQRLFSTNGSYNYSQKHKALTEILNRFKRAIPKTYQGRNSWFRSTGDSLDDVMKELEQQLTFQSKGGNFIDYRSNYAPRVANAGARVEQKTFEVLNGKMKPFYSKQITATTPREAIGLEELIAARINAQGKRMYLYDELESVAKYASKLPSQWRDYTEHVIARSLNVPSKADEWLAKGIDKVWIGKQGWDARRVMRLTKNVNDLAYMGFLGIRPFSAMRNLFQPFILVPADLGGIKDYGTLARGMNKVYGKGGAAVREEINRMGIITEYAPETLRTRQLFGGTGKKVLGTKGIGKKGYIEVPSIEAVRDTMSFMFSGADKLNRYTTASSAMVKWDGALRKVGGKVTGKNIKNFIRQSGAQGRQPWVKREIEEKLMFGSMGDARKQFVTDVVADTQFLYNILESPIVGQSLGGVGRTATIFQSWWSNYGAVLNKWMSTGQSPSHWMGKKGAKVERMLTGVISSFGVYQAMSQLWGKGTAARSTFTGPFPDPSQGLSLPPAWQVPANAMGMVFAAAALPATQNPKILSKQGMALIDSVTNFIPGGVLGKQIIKGIKKERAGERGAIIRAPFKFRDFSKPLK